MSFKLCPYVQRVVASLVVKDIDYEVEYIDLDNPPEWFGTISPLNKVPILITQKGVALFESDAIVEYLADEYGELHPLVDNEVKALARANSYLGIECYGHHHHAMLSYRKIDQQNTFENEVKSLGVKLDAVEFKLDTHQFFMSDSIGRVDVAWLPTLHRFNVFQEMTNYDFIADYPKITRWTNTIRDMGLFEKTTVNDFEEVFKQYYVE